MPFESPSDCLSTPLTHGMIAQLIPRKGHRHLQTILPQMVHRHPDARVVSFGKEPHGAALERHVRQEGLASYVLFAGFREDLARWLPCLDINVHLAYMKGLWISLVHGAAARVPIVATCVGGIPEAVEEGCTGMFIKPKILRGLTRALSFCRRILTNGEPWAKRVGRWCCANSRSRQGAAAASSSTTRFWITSDEIPAHDR